jgi:hypothetical protein
MTTDIRMTKALEEQLATAHTTNSELRNQLLEKDVQIAHANTDRVRGLEAEAALEAAYTKRKAAEDSAAVARRKCEEAELEAVRLRGELQELRVQFAIVKEDADRVRAIDDRVAKAKHAGELFS